MIALHVHRTHALGAWCGFRRTPGPARATVWDDAIIEPAFGGLEDRIADRAGGPAQLQAGVVGAAERRGRLAGPARMAAGSPQAVERNDDEDEVSSVLARAVCKD